MTKIIIIASILLVVFSCKKDRLKDDKEMLIGSWNWVYTNHSFGWCQGESWEETLTPESENEFFSLLFKEKGELIFYKNTAEIEKKRIVFEYFKPYDDTHYIFSIYMDNKKDDKIGGYVDVDTLILGDFPFTSNQGCESHYNCFAKQ